MDDKKNNNNRKHFESLEIQPRAKYLKRFAFQYHWEKSKIWKYKILPDFCFENCVKRTLEIERPLLRNLTQVQCMPLSGCEPGRRRYVRVVKMPQPCLHKL